MKTSKWLVTAIAVALFIILFYQKSIGVNVSLFGLATFFLFVLFKPEFFQHRLNSYVMVGMLASSLAYGLWASDVAFLMAIASYFILFGLHVRGGIRNILMAVPSILNKYFMAWGDFFHSFASRKQRQQTKGLQNVLRVIVLPLLVLFFFVFLYSLGSPVFAKGVTQMFDAIADLLTNWMSWLNVGLIAVALLGLLLGVIHALGIEDNWISKMEAPFKDRLLRTRVKQKRYFRNMDLKFEYRSAVFLFVCLNLLLLVLLGVEIATQWFNYSWDGQFLKASVHQGTYVLIFSIALSIGLVAYFFRKNLNFLRDNKMLLYLAQMWLALNALLVVSVAIRNMHYVDHFALAYKRIGVFYFLLLCLVGLVTVWLKIANKKSLFYLVRRTALAVYVVLLTLGMVNWDGYIAKYNMNHTDKAFLHLDYVMELGDNALPHLLLSPSEMDSIEEQQLNAIPFASKGYFDEVGYAARLETKLISFNHRYKAKTWLEKTWGEYRVYTRLNTTD